MAVLLFKHRFSFIAGHLLQHLTINKQYPVISPGPHTKTIMDDSGKVIHISKTAQRRYFIHIKE